MSDKTRDSGDESFPKIQRGKKRRTVAPVAGSDFEVTAVSERRALSGHWHPLESQWPVAQAFRRLVLGQSAFWLGQLPFATSRTANRA
jgi:hypothetical protein